MATDKRIKSMNAVNAVKLFILVWTFTAVCRADDDITVNCEDVTGAVGKEATLTCSVSLHRSECCITLYKCYTNNSTIYKQEHHQDSCGRQRKSFTCRYTPTTAEPGPFRFFVQTTCGWKVKEFTVDIPEPRTGHITGSEESPAFPVIAAVAGCFIIIIIILMTIIYKMKPNYSKPYGLQKRMLLGSRHDDDDSNCSVNII